jgi:DNA-binding CsgD family transcriptional regulator
VLAEVLEDAARGRGRVVVIEGNAGAGKSALLREAVTVARDLGVGVLRARGGEMEREAPYGLLRQLFEPTVRRLEPDARDDVLWGAAAPAAQALGLSGEATGSADGFAIAHAIFWLVAGLAAPRPLLLAVDDAHWGDVSSLAALEHLARRIDDLGVTLLVSLRPAEPGAPAGLLDALRQVPGASRLAPAPLSVEAVSEVLEAHWSDVPESVSMACHDVTGGNPLLLAELLRLLPAADCPTSEAVFSASASTLEERVLRRTARVGSAAPAFARAAAVLGDGAQLSVAAELAGIDAAHAATLAHGLLRIEVLASEDPLAFVHPLVRQSLYDGMPLGERHTLHAGAAEVLLARGAPPEVALAHLSVLPPAGSVAVASAHLHAAEAALGRGAPAEATRWLERAIAEDAPEPTRAVLLARLGLTQASARDPAAIAVLGEAYDSLEDAELRRLVAIELAYTLAVSGAWEQSAALIERAEADLAEDPAAVTELAAVRATLELHDARRSADFDASRPALERILDDYEDWGSDAVAAIIGNEAAYRGRIDTARHELARARRGHRLLGERGAGGWAVPMLLGLPIIIDELDQAQELIDEAERAGRASGSALATLTALTCAAWLRARRGDLIGAEVDLATVLSLGQETGMAMLVANVSLYLIDVLLERDGAAPAAAVIENMAVPPEFLPTWSGAMLIEARGRLRLAHGAREAAIADLRDAGATASALGFGPTITGWRSALALALLGDAPDEAAALVQEELRLARASGLVRPQTVALRTLGILHGRQDAGVAYLRESVTLSEAGPSPLEHARSLVALGSALRRGNQVRQARAALNAGLDLASACGAERLRSEAQQELLAAGGRRRRRDERGADSLTASELRVARLAATGLSNLEIAQRLFVSVKTVETHLAHVYGKCDLAGTGSRWRLAGVLGEAA